MDINGWEDPPINKFAIKVAFATNPLAAMTCKKISKVAHTHYLTQIMKDDKPSCVTVHKHRPVFGANKVVQLGKINSVKGWDEYAATSNFSFEAPQQALWVTVPKNGVVWQAPVLAGDRKSEGW